MGRVLSDEEANSLGLNDSAPSAPRARRVLSDEEANSLGLNGAAPVAKAAALPADANKPDMVSSLLHGGGQGATLGFGDEINGGIQALGDMWRGENGSFGDLYRHNRDSFRREDVAAQKAHPIAYGVGEIAGGTPGMIATGGGVGAGLKGAAAMGAVTALGNSDADNSGALVGDSAHTDLGGALRDTAIGGASGAVGHALGAGIGKASGYLREKAGNLAYRAAGPRLANIRALGVDKVADAGNRLLDKGVVKFGDDAARVASRAAPAADEAGKRIGHLRDMLDKAKAQWNPQAVQQGVQQDVIAPLGTTGSKRAVVAKLQDEVAALGGGQQGPQPLSALAKEIEGVDGQINYAKANQDPSGQALMQYRQALDKQFDAAASAASPELANAHNAAQADYHLLKPAEKMADDQANRTAVNRILSLGDRAGGGAVGALAGGLSGDDGQSRSAGAVLGGLAGVYGGRLARTRGAASGAVLARLGSKAAEAVAPALQQGVRGAIPALSAAVSHFTSHPNKVARTAMSNPTALGRYGGVLNRAVDPAQGGSPAKFATMNFVLAKDPGYQQHVQNLPEEENESE